MIRSMDIHLHVTAGAARTAYWLVVAADLVFILGTAASDLGYSVLHPEIAHQLDLKTEGVLAVWYSSSLLLLNCMGCLFTAFRGPLSRMERGAWLVVAAALGALSADETAMLHERVGEHMAGHGLKMALFPEAYPLFNWLVPAAPLAMLFLVAMFRGLRGWVVEHPRGRRLAVAGMACWVGVLVAEVVESQMRRYGMERSLQGALEEGLELAGSTLLLMALLESLKGRGGRGEKADGAEPALS